MKKMKTGKRIFSMILVFALVLTMLPAVTFAANTGVKAERIKGGGGLRGGCNKGVETDHCADG